MNRPTDSVRIVIFDKQDTSHFLALTESDDHGNWKLPGGSFESEHEEPDAAANRELEEELSLGGAAVGLHLAGNLVNDDGHSARHIYVGAIGPDTQLEPSKEIAESGWFTEDTVPEGKNRGHILTAVATARAALIDKDK